MGMVAILVMWPEPFKQLSFSHPMETPYEIWLTGQAVSEEKMFKDCWRRWTDNGVCLYYKLTYELKGSGF